MSRKIVIVGGVAAGATLATRLRRLSEEVDITIIEKDEFISFANCGLPYHISGVIKKRSNLIVETVENMSNNFNITIKNFTKGIKINKENKTLLTKNKLTNEENLINYDKLILATGATPIKPNIKGIKDSKNIFTLRNIADMDKIINFIKNNDIKNATVVGGGFIGLEVMENLKIKGLNVTLVEQQNQVMTSFDYELSQLIHKKIKSHDIRLILNDGVKEFKNEGSIIKLNSNREIKSDIIILAIGVKAENELALSANLNLTDKGYIQVDDYFKTSDDNIYAIGDVIEVNTLLDNSKMPVSLAGPANKQARYLANHLLGDFNKYKGASLSSITKIFDLTVAVTGYNENMLKDKKIKYDSIILHPNNHASYYPGYSSLSIKVLFELNTYKILGSQIIGNTGVDKRIDVIQTAMHANLSVIDLKDLDLAYAPPFSNAKDPINMIGYIAENMKDGLIEFVDLKEFRETYLNNKYDVIFLDVRDKYEYNNSHLPNSINMLVKEIRKNINLFDKNKEIYVYCQVGIRSYNASRILSLNGYKVKTLKGGLKTYDCLYEKDGSDVCFSETTDLGKWSNL